MLSQFTKLGPFQTFKILFQIIFAIVPVVLFFIVRRYATTTISALATFLFIAMPVFYTDMSMLLRQEIAFLFLATIILVIFDTRMPSGGKIWLMALFSWSLVVSHYSTTFLTIGLFIGGYVVYAALRGASKTSLFKKLVRHSQITIERPRITLALLAMLLLFSAVWYGLVSGHSAGLTKIIEESIFFETM
jgi:uncharacterized membrane protein